MDSLTVIIPTFNRNAVLKRALEAYCAQKAPEAIHELIVVDDGSTDDTESTVAEMGLASPFPLRYLRQTNLGPAAARNLGIRTANSSVILFTDSDVVPTADLVAEHLEWHNEHPQENVAVLGYVTWPSQPRPTQFMRWYGERQLFAYRRIRQEQHLDASSFYTSNLSLKTQFLTENGLFDEGFKTAAYEDLELGYRLSKAGLRLLFNPRAVAYHHQFFRFSDACRKSNENGAARKVFFRTEMGRDVLERQRQRRSQPRYRMARFGATALATILDPATRFVDSDLRFPSSLYRLLFWHHTTGPLELDDSASALG